MLDDVLSVIQSDLIDLAAKTGVVCSALVGAGLTFFGIKWVTKRIIGFFYVLGGGEPEDYYGRDNSDPEGWTAEDEYEYRYGGAHYDENGYLVIDD